MSHPEENTGTLSPHQKAFALNLDHAKYGTIAEIGAGQEVGRWFYRVGGASGTVAMTVSAYDKIFSDAIYGAGGRYVSRPRVETMLDKEYGLLVERLDESRGEKTTFFAFANTVVARSFSFKEDGHGWLGIRFQTKPRAEPSRIIVHVRLLDKEPNQQQETIGILGVNLIHGAMFLHAHPDTLLRSLVDNLTADRAEIDLIDFSGPAFEGVDNRIMALKLVEEGLTGATMFLASGEVVQPADELYKKAILVERGSFRPVTVTNLDILRCARAQFVQEPLVQGKDIFVLTEMQMRNLTQDGECDYADFLERVDILSALGKNVLITNYFEFHRLAAYLFRYTRNMIGVCMGVATLKEIFEEKYYEDLAGGILESFGRLFKNDLKLYAYPTREAVEGGAIISTANLSVAPHLRHLYAYLIDNRFIEGLRGYNESYLPIFANDVLARIAAGDRNWESLVPPVVAHRIMERRLFGYTGPQPPPLDAYLASLALHGGADAPEEAEQIPPIDEVQLREAAGGDPILARELLAGFEEEATALLAQLSSQLRASDASAARETARSIRGTASTLGYLGLRALAREIEEAARKGDLDAGRAAIDRFSGELSSLKTAFAKLQWD
jgi:HPt (histidine-containing phosphotransfer) domain-containing protein